MLLSDSKAQVERDLHDEAARCWGPDRARELRADIDKVAGWLAVISQYEMEMDADEPDFLVAPGVDGEAGDGVA